MEGRMSLVAELNDLLRSSLDERFGAVILSQGVASKHLALQISVREAVRAYGDFTSDNDPNGEHDFGEFELNEERYCWKIDCEGESADLSGRHRKGRRLTIMFADEYWLLKSEQFCI
jgi:hypothetical protein